MFFYADLHIHSKYSRATSKSCNLEELAIWAQKKGLSIISTGDFTHPAWFNEIKEKLVPAGNGVFRLRPDIENRIFKNIDKKNIVKFLLSVEISTIYKKWDKTRKVHHVVFSPSIEKVEIFRNRLDSIGNIKSDGRPILGLDSRDLLEITLESSEDAYIIPAHIWTPWFSALGSKSGFNSIQDCYGDLANHIFAVETGLSSDPQMNWRVSSLDKYRLVSNSDAHSPSKLAREATVFDTDTDYFSIMNALKTGQGYIGTVEFFPEEGKYHEDGHRKCNICLTPEETIKLNGICPVCNKPLTIGVLYRVNELADKKEMDFSPPSTAGKTFSLVPLAEILSEVMQVGPNSKSVCSAYENLIEKLGSELSILQDVPIDDISKAFSPILAEGISRLREGKVIKKAGYDGEYGVIKLFQEDELVKKKYINLSLDLPKIQNKTSCKSITDNRSSIINKFDDLSKDINKDKININEKVASSLDEYQESAIKNSSKKLLIVAGPGSGKTTVLTRRIAYMISEKNILPENCLAITFTKKAAQEMRDRLRLLLNQKYDLINIHTFHSLCFSILKKNANKVSLNGDFKVISPQEKSLYKEKGISLENKLEFDDLIKYTLKLFNQNPDIVKSYQDLFKYISVDEYQDIDENQYNLIKFLANKNSDLCAIGDPNQAIYGFRGGDSKFFNSFSIDYPNAQIINLKNNYRSTNTIVNASNQMINSFNIISKYDKPHDLINIHTAATDKAEAQFIISSIENLIGGHSFFSIDSKRSSGEESNYSFGDFAILYRSSSQLKVLIEALEQSGMPFAKLSNDLLCDKKSVRNLLSKLSDDKPLIDQLSELALEFSEDIDDYILKYLLNLSKSFISKEDFIHQVSLLSEIDTLDKRADRISLMTLHASKGLEFNCVFIVGLENGILPSYLAKEAKEIEEEKRLLYVGMTRAKQKLFLTRAIKRKVYGSLKNQEISPFLAKIEQDLLTLTTFKNKTQVKDKANSSQLTLFK